MVKIAHISDLHFLPKEGYGSQFEYTALQDSIVNNGADIIVVTGDLIDNPLNLSSLMSRYNVMTNNAVKLAYKECKEYLLGLCSACSIDPQEGLFVVPGNHDYRFHGVFTSDYSAEQFNDIFGDFFRSDLYINNDICVAICLLDSNVASDWKINAATGQVGKNAVLTELRDKYNEWDQSDEFSLSVKVAALHHHVMPIAETEGNNYVGSEEFMVLKNSGFLLKTLASFNIDLILHGHKHYPGITRVGYLGENGLPVNLGIIAAGSANDSDKLNSYNMIYLDKEGGISAKHYASNNTLYDSWKPAFQLLSEQEIHNNRYVQYAKELEHEFRCESLTHSCNILSNGDVEWDKSYRKLECKSENAVDHMPDEFWWPDTSLYLEPKIESKNEDHLVAFSIDEEAPDGKIAGRYIFTPPLSDSKISMDLHWLIGNAFYFDARDMPPDQPLEFVAFTAKIKADRLNVCVKFPENFQPNNVIVEAMKAEGEGDIDHRETKYARNQLIYNKNTNVITFAIDKPLPSFTYKIKWDLQDGGLTRNMKGSQVAEARTIREATLSLNDEEKNQVETQLGQLRDIFNVPKLYGQEELRHNYEISLLGFDDINRNLNVVAMSACQDGLYPEDDEVWDLKFANGEGVAGQALRRKEPVLYSEQLPDLRTPPVYKEAGVCTNTQKKKYKLIYSIPIMYPPDEGMVVGIISFATCSNDCGLYVMTEEYNDRKSFVEQTLIQFYKAFVGNVMHRNDIVNKALN